MSYVTVGLFEKDSRMYYIDEHVAILDNPFTHIPTAVIRRPLTDKTLAKSLMSKALRDVGMEPVGEPFYRADGLLCQSLKEASNVEK